MKTGADLFDEVLSRFGRRLRTARERAGLTRDELARRLDVSAQSVKMWEGYGTMPHVGRIIEIASAIGVTPGYLLAFSDDDEQVAACAGVITRIPPAQREVALRMLAGLAEPA